MARFVDATTNSESLAQGLLFLAWRVESSNSAGLESAMILGCCPVLSIDESFGDVTRNGVRGLRSSGEELGIRTSDFHTFDLANTP
jgi:hypothetical protein